MRYEIAEGELPFELGEPTDSVVPVPDALLVIRKDGQATYGLDDQPEIKFRVPEEDLSAIETALAEIDFEEAAETLGGETKEGLPTFSVSHDGTTVALGGDSLATPRGEGPVLADQMNELLERLDGIVGQAPGVEKAADAYLREVRNGCPLGAKLAPDRSGRQAIVASAGLSDEEARQAARAARGSDVRGALPGMDARSGRRAGRPSPRRPIAGPRAVGPTCRRSTRR